MPPPIRMRSARFSRWPITASLSDGFLPPSTTTKGRAGSVVSWRSTATSSRTRSPAACGSSPGRSYTEACLRCTAPNPSPTYSSPKRASRAANAPRSASSLLVSAGSKRTFSKTATSSSPRLNAVSSAEGPATSVANETGRPSSSPSRAATGRSDGPPAARSSKVAPLGRPRCARTITRAPRSDSLLITGRLARIRPSSVISPVPVRSSGTFRSDRSSTRRPMTSRSSM